MACQNFKGKFQIHDSQLDDQVFLKDHLWLSIDGEKWFCDSELYVNVAMYDSEPTAATSAGPRHSVLSEVT